MCCRSILTFSAASEDDLGLYTAEVIDKPDISSSFNFTAEGTISIFLSSGSVTKKLKENVYTAFFPQMELISQDTIGTWSLNFRKLKNK